MRSNYIKWLFEQQYRTDSVGYLVNCILTYDEFDPMEFPDIIEQIEKFHVKQKVELKSIAYESLIEFVTNIICDKHLNKVVIKETDILQQKLNTALKYENYLEAAKLRDELKKLK